MYYFVVVSLHSVILSRLQKLFSTPILRHHRIVAPGSTIGHSFLSPCLLFLPSTLYHSSLLSSLEGLGPERTG